MILRYNPKLKLRAREMRKNQTHAEQVLWDKIKGRQVKGLQFLRQRPIGNFIVDFVCFKAKLIVEIDGPIHLQQKEIDTFRQEQLEMSGFRVLRFSNKDIEESIDGVIRYIGMHT